MPPLRGLWIWVPVTWGSAASPQAIECRAPRLILAGWRVQGSAVVMCGCQESLQQTTNNVVPTPPKGLWMISSCRGPRSLV